VPTAVGVYVTEQLWLLPDGLARVQVVLLKVPLPLEEKVTVPDGGNAVPPAWVSVTVAVQVVDCATTTEAGTQLTVVEVDRVVTDKANVPELAEWTELAP
jgi:hypothetical protein